MESVTSEQTEDNEVWSKLIIRSPGTLCMGCPVFIFHRNDSFASFNSPGTTRLLSVVAILTVIFLPYLSKWKSPCSTNLLRSLAITIPLAIAFLTSNVTGAPFATPCFTGCWLISALSSADHLVYFPHFLHLFSGTVTSLVFTSFSFTVTSRFTTPIPSSSVGADDITCRGAFGTLSN